MAGAGICLFTGAGIWVFFYKNLVARPRVPGGGIRIRTALPSEVFERPEPLGGSDFSEGLLRGKPRDTLRFRSVQDAQDANDGAIADRNLVSAYQRTAPQSRM